MEAENAIAVGDVVNLGVSLIVIVLAILLVGWLYGKARSVGGPNRHVMRIVASQALGPKERVMLVEVGDTQLMLGVTASQIQTLHVLETPVVTEPETAGPASFAVRLQSALKGRALRGEPA